MSRAGYRAGGAAAAALYLIVLASAAPHQVHHAGERLAELLQPRRAAHSPGRGYAAGKDPARPLPRPAADRTLPPGGACPLGSALAWKAGELPGPAPAGPPAGAAEAVAPRAFVSQALFDPSSFSIRAPPLTAGS
jgi:hypothetical protein